MGWDNVELKGVNPNFELIPANDYTYQVVPGAKIDDYGNLSIQLSIASEGESAGRRVFLRFPDPARPNCGWVPKALKRLEQAVGIEQEEGEKLVAWAQRLGENFARFSAPLQHRTYKNQAGEDVTSEDVKISKARAAA